MFKKVWDWCKKNPWKALFFPLVLLVMVLTWLLAGDKKTFGQVVSGTLDSDARDAMKAKDAAMSTYRENQKRIASDIEDKLNKASNEQLKELKKKTDEEPEKVATWIDSLS